MDLQTLHIVSVLIGLPSTNLRPASLVRPPVYVKTLKPYRICRHACPVCTVQECLCSPRFVLYARISLQSSFRMHEPVSYADTNSNYPTALMKTPNAPIYTPTMNTPCLLHLPVPNSVRQLLAPYASQSNERQNRPSLTN